MTKLNQLHLGLDRVRRYRKIIRWGSALAVFVSVTLWVLLGAFLLDVSTHMGRLERVLVLVIFCGLAAWTYYRYVRPAAKTSEAELDLALLVERQQGIRSDLVAALQFADAGRSQFGSSGLRTAVVDRTDKTSQSINYLDGFSRGPLLRRGIILALTVLIALLPTLTYGEHVRVFFQRFLLGNALYPTRTIIQEVLSPGAKAVYGQSVHFEVRVAGEIPERGVVNLRTTATGVKTTIELLPDNQQPNVFVGRLERALDDLTYSIHLGDAYTLKETLNLIPLPIVDVDFQIETPAYAAGKFAAARSGRQPVALEGSRVVPLVSSDKTLKSATMMIDGREYPLTNNGKVFTFANTQSPLDRVQATVRYQVQVVDEDGIELPDPISGTLEVRADQPPRIAAATVTHYVLPTAAPQVKFRAIDDFGLDRIEVQRRVEQLEATSDPVETTELVAELAGREETFERKFALSLADLKLTKGDRVVVTFRATDFRGDDPGKSTESDRIVFHVTDRAGILSNMRWLDGQVDEKLDEIIKAQLGIGGSR